MLESLLQELLISTIAAGIAAWTGPTLPSGLTVQQAFQPRQQGVPSGPAVFIHHKATTPRGFPLFSNYTDTNNVMMRKEQQRKESTYQIGSLVPQSPLTPNQLTEVDVLNIIRHILQGLGTLLLLNAQDVGVFRVSTIDSNYFIDDKSQNENNPIFDIILTHSDVVTYPAQAITGVSSGLYPI